VAVGVREVWLPVAVRVGVWEFYFEGPGPVMEADLKMLEREDTTGEASTRASLNCFEIRDETLEMNNR